MADRGRSGPERLAEVVERIARERRPERLGQVLLDGAMAVTGARAGWVSGPVGGGRSARLAQEGATDQGTPDIEAPLEVADGPLGHIALFGAEAEPCTVAALRVVAAHGALALDAVRLARARGDDRRRARRLAMAAEALRAITDPREAITTALADARALTATPAAVLVAAGAARLETAACDGTDPLTETELAALVPGDMRVALAQGEHWRGPLAVDNPLRARGFLAGAVAGIGQRAALGYLAVLSEHEEGIDADGLEALGGLAGHTAAALTTVVLQREVRDLGAVDPLTRFFNARYFRTRLDQEVQRARRTGAPLSVAVLSLDGLADVRAEGRAASGDAAMQALSTHVAARLRSMDVGCRVGEDELAAILPEVEGIDAFRVGERLRASLRDDPVLTGAFTLSVGVSSFPDQAAGHDELFERSQQAMAWARLHGGDRTFLYHRDAAAILEAEEQRRTADEESLLATLLALATSVDSRDPGTIGHSDNVGRLSGLIAAELGFPPEHTERVALAGRLHDLGKAGMRREVVVAGGPLEHSELEELQRHPEIGARMLMGCALEDMTPWVRHHHERVDGGGYPAGLRGDAIPVEARIIAAADAFDRLVGGARGPLAPEEALGRVEHAVGAALDAGAVAALGALVRRGAAAPAPGGSS
ncbi:MAG: diguanylate cyclase [Miltoncostaeaceae bacterium]